MPLQSTVLFHLTAPFGHSIYLNRSLFYSRYTLHSVYTVGWWVTDILRKHEKSSAFGRLECPALLLSIKYPTISYSVLSVSDPQILSLLPAFCESTYIIVQCTIAKGCF